LANENNYKNFIFQLQQHSNYIYISVDNSEFQIFSVELQIIL